MITGYLSLTLFPILRLIGWSLFGAFAILLLLRLTFNYTDPNPFGKVGRFGFKIRKITERFVYPATRFLAMYRIDMKLAPLLPLLIGLALTFFAINIIGDVCFIIDGFASGLVAGNSKMIFGIAIYALLGLLMFLIFIRVIASYFVFARKTFMGFVMRVTDPIMLPVQKLIPTIGPLDISAMIVLILIGFLQNIVLRSMVFVP